ncbi:MAG TPA: MBL fold metallo-hydrolase [Gemmataceae bacterium]|jgi:glyoxylase-like metal-dependent hydrolase (beta-lactamase superfamily II)
MLKRFALLAAAVGAFAFALYAAAERTVALEGPVIPEMKFNDVKEIAPGVFFRYSSISATDKTIPFGGSNHTWIVFKDYVVVIDANFPKEAGDVIADIKKTTKKPIKYVLDTHHHGDHAYGNAVWAKEGAQIVAHKTAARLLKVNGPKQWEEASKGIEGREDLRKSELKQVDIPFDDKYVLDDGTQRVEFLHFGHSHTSGDAVAYLPKHKILCTGDACGNGAFNYFGHANTASWIKCLDGMKKLDVAIVCPGHGKPAPKELLDKQKRYIAELRKAVADGIDSKKSLEEITKNLNFPWYKEWTGVDVAGPAMNKDNVKHVYQELTGKIDHDRLGMSPAPLDWRAGPQGIAVTRR